MIIRVEKMISVLMSKMEIGFPMIEDEIKKYVNEKTVVTIIPWSFPVETDGNGLDEYYKNKIKEKYCNPFLKIGVKEENINYLNCYKDDLEFMKTSILNTDILVLTGGNPEMFYNKVVSIGLLNTIKNFNKVIIGSSAGAELQLSDYFITAKNNYYQQFDWYKGFGIISNSFFFDVHSLNDEKYLSQFYKIARSKQKNVYAVFNDGVIIYNRENKNIQLYGNVLLFPYK